jgi:hypothetical protein
MLPYMDDFLVFADSYQAGHFLRARVDALLTRFGVLRNTKKGTWNPPRWMTT